MKWATISYKEAALMVLRLQDRPKSHITLKMFEEFEGGLPPFIPKVGLSLSWPAMALNPKKPIETPKKPCIKNP